MPQEEALNSIKAPHTDGNSAALHSGRWALALVASKKDWHHKS